jgi:hypothetical protein
MTPDQVRLRLERVQATMGAGGSVQSTIRELYALLNDVLPELAALSSGRTDHHADDRFHTHGIDGLGPTEWTDDTSIRQARADGYQRGYDVATARAESRFALGLPIEYGANVGLTPFEVLSRQGGTA